MTVTLDPTTSVPEPDPTPPVSAVPDTPSKGPWRDFRESLIGQVLAGQKWIILLFAVLASTAAALGAAFADTARRLIDEGIVERTAEIRPLATSMMVITTIGLFLGLALRQTIAKSIYTVEFELRTRLYHSVQGADPRRLDTLSTGQLLTRALTDLETLLAVILLIPGLAFGAVLVVGLAGYLVYLQPILGSLSLAALPANYFLIRRIWPRLRGLAWLQLNSRAEVTTAIDESVRGARVVKAFGRADETAATVNERAKDAYSFGIGWVRLTSRYDPILRVIPIVIDGLVLFFGFRLIQSGSMTLGTFGIFILLAGGSTALARGFDEIAAGSTYAGAGSRRMLEVMGLAAAPVDTGRTLSLLPPPAGGLELDGVAAQVHDRTVLRAFDLAVRPGELVVVTGTGPAATAALTGLVTGTLRPSEGTVRLDGADPAEVAARPVLEAVQVLGEEPFLFSRTVRENLDLRAGTRTKAGNVEAPASDEVMWAALRAAAVDDAIEQLPQKLDTVLGDRGLTLSGGQRQRLALARALVKPPRVLVLEDALSAVNPTLELEILRRLAEHAPATGVLVITRRPSASAVATRVVELDNSEDRAAADAVAVATAAGVQEVDLDADATGRGLPTDSRLRELVQAVQVDRLTPDVPASVLDDVVHPPTIANVLRPFRGLAVIGVGGLLGFTLVELAQGGLTKTFIDAAEANDRAAGNRVVLSVLGLAILAGATTYVHKLFIGRVDRGIMYLLRRRTFARLNRLGVDFYDREVPGQVAARVVKDLDTISNFLERGMTTIAGALMLIVGTAVVLAVWSPPVFVLYLVALVASLVLTAVQFRLADRALTRVRERLGEVVARMQEDFAGRYVITSFGAERAAEEGFIDSAMSLRHANRWAAVINTVYEGAVSWVTGIATAVLLLTAGNLALEGDLSRGSVLALTGYLLRALDPLGKFAENFRRLLEARVAFRKLDELYAAPIRPVERPDAVSCPPLEGEIDFEDVSFSYPGTSRAVLEGVSLSIDQGERIAIVGTTGAGKSSLAKLLARTYDPDAGAVLVDGHDLRDLDLQSYRKRLGVVPQDAFLFAGTVSSNIAFGRPEASADEIRAAAAAVGATSAIDSLPHGFGCRVEEEGRNLPAAHRQLIALARAWLVEPELLVLDEATANLEPAHEQAVLDAVTALGRTTILVAHRLTIAEQADRVVVVEGGRIVEVGDHASLLGAGGPYAALWGDAAPTRRRTRRRTPPSGS